MTIEASLIDDTPVNSAFGRGYLRADNPSAGLRFAAVLFDGPYDFLNRISHSIGPIEMDHVAAVGNRLTSVLAAIERTRGRRKRRRGRGPGEHSRERMSIRQHLGNE